jgi:hypothetical protein
MAFPWTYAFAYNTGSTINNTEQLGNLAIATGLTLGGGVSWWNGPDFQLGYVIARPVSGGTQPTPIGGLSAYTGFIRSDALDDTSYVTMANEFKNRFAISPPTFDSPEQVATYANVNQLWTSWIPCVDEIIYSGDSYDSLWTSGETSSGPGVSIVYTYEPTYLSLSLSVGFGQVAGRWITNRMYDLNCVNEIEIVIDVSSALVEVIIYNGEDEYTLGFDSGSGLQTIYAIINDGYPGYWFIIVKAVVSGTAATGYIDIYSVKLKTLGIANPYPFPIWNNIIANPPSAQWTYTQNQLTNMGEGISFDVTFNNNNISVWYYISNSQIDPDEALSPDDNGFTELPNAQFVMINNNQWLTFGATTVEAGSGTDLVTIYNGTNGTSLGQFYVTWTQT